MADCKCVVLCCVLCMGVHVYVGLVMNAWLIVSVLCCVVLCCVVLCCVYGCTCMWDWCGLRG